MSFLVPRYLSTCQRILPQIRNTFFSGRTIQRNYWRRRDAFSELSSAMQYVENYMKEMDREMNRLIEGSPFKIKKIFAPLERLPSRVREIPVLSTDGGRVYKLELEMQGMEPENISITLQDRELTITARKEENGENGSRFIKENKYHYTLPDEVNPEAIRSTLADGVLMVEAPLPALESKEIPIKVESGQKPKSDSSSEK